MKGQFFILGAILISILLFAALPIRGPELKTTLTKDMVYLSDNVKNEFPKAVNLGLSSDKAIDTLRNFTEFVEAVMNEHFIDFNALWLLEQPFNTNINLTVGNFFDEDVTVYINLSNDLRSLHLPKNSTNYTVFSSVPEEFDLVITFGNRTKIIHWFRDKVNLYMFFSMGRGEEILINELKR